MSTEKFSKYYILDTNILLQDAHSIVKFSEESSNLIVLPETVLDELDSKKHGFEEINFQAREFGRILSDAKIISTQHLDEYTIIRIYINSTFNTTIDIITKQNYKSNFSNCSLDIINDRKILEVTKDCINLYKTHSGIIEFVSNDIMARTRAISLGLQTSAMLGDKKEYDLEFHKEIKIEEELNEKSFHLKDIKKIDPDYKMQNYCYTLIVGQSEKHIYGYILNNKFNLIEPEKDYKELKVKPLSVEQKFFCSALLEDKYNIVTVDAKAGSGKTLLALSVAIRLVDLKKHSKILYVRNSIESTDKGEDVGYLPGLEEKFKIYNHPLMDSIDFIVRNENKSKKTKLLEKDVSEKIDEMKKNYHIETMWVGEMRGRTITESFVIVDEAQNISNKTLQMIFSRLDSTCKVVVVGSNAQIDNLYVNKHTNGLTTTLKSTCKDHEEVNMFACKLNKVYRGPITAWAEKIFS